MISVQAAGTISFIDRKMVKLRNEIAHGEMRPVTREEYDELKEFIQAALNGFKESIEEAARGRIYLSAVTKGAGPTAVPPPILFRNPDS